MFLSAGKLLKKQKPGAPANMEASKGAPGMQHRQGGGNTPVSVFRRHPQIGDNTLIRIAYAFCQGIRVDAAAKAAGLSRKSVRAVYLDLRPRLKKPAFRRWNSLVRALVHVDDPEADALMRAAFLDVLAGCYGNQTCLKTYRRGNRKDRLCRSCPISGKFSSVETAIEAVALVDQLRAFHERLGLRESPNMDLERFRECLIYFSTVETVRQHSAQLPNGLLDPSDQDYLAIGQLHMLIMDDLAADQDG